MAEYSSPLGGGRGGGFEGSPSGRPAGDDAFVLDATPTISPFYRRSSGHHSDSRNNYYGNRQQQWPYRGGGRGGCSTPHRGRGGPHFFHSDRRGPRQRNFHRDGGGGDVEVRGFFHPSMLDNPWAELEKKFEASSAEAKEKPAAGGPDSESSSEESDAEQ